MDNVMHRTYLLVCILFSAVLSPLAMAESTETLPEGLKVESITAFPATIELSDRFAYRQLVLTGRLETGETVDLTRMATLVETSDLVAVTELGLVSPQANRDNSWNSEVGIS